MPEVDRSSRLLDAVVALSADLSLPNVLRRIVEAAAEVSGAAYGALGVIGPEQAGLEGGLVEFITTGLDAKAIRAIGDLPHGRGILGLLITDPKPQRIRDIGAHPASSGFPPASPADAIVPRGAHPGPRRGLRQSLPHREAGRRRVHRGRRGAGGGAAGAAGVAIENARLHQRLEQMAVLGERERIARDLHDTVIQRLFATGLGLQGLVGRIEGADLRERLQQAVDELDETIREIRISIFDLEARDVTRMACAPGFSPWPSEVTPTLGFEPKVHMEGPLDTATDAPTRDELLKTMREALSNVAKHAAASSVDVRLSAGAGTITLRVADNGVGIPGGPARGHGLDNMEARAEALGGVCEFTGRPGGGTVVTWRVPSSP